MKKRHFKKYIAPHASSDNQFRWDPNFQIFLIAEFKPKSDVTSINAPAQRAWLMLPCIRPCFYRIYYYEIFTVVATWTSLFTRWSAMDRPVFTSVALEFSFLNVLIFGGALFTMAFVCSLESNQSLITQFCFYIIRLTKSLHLLWHSHVIYTWQNPKTYFMTT